MGNFFDELCVDCNENLHIDGFRCYGCEVTFSEEYYAELFYTQEAN